MVHVDAVSGTSLPRSDRALSIRNPTRNKTAKLVQLPIRGLPLPMVVGSIMKAADPRHTRLPPHAAKRQLTRRPMPPERSTLTMMISFGLKLQQRKW
jgi:hypothetical protein